VTIAGVLYFCLLANDESEKQVRVGREGRRQGGREGGREGGKGAGKDTSPPTGGRGQDGVRGQEGVSLVFDGSR
jgi:hypothetical protein